MIPPAGGTHDRQHGHRIILHVDMDSFFASVEVREHPELEGKPVVVGADPRGGHGRGVVSTASYEARKYGIHSAMPISRAWNLCPDAVYLPPHFPLYEQASGSVMEILRRYADRVEQVSIDEAYLDLSDTGSFEAAQKIGERIKSEIGDREHLTCSIGIGPGRVIAKIATDTGKPDGLVVVSPDRAAGFLAPLPVEKIPGIGKKTTGILHGMGISTIGDLAGADIQKLIGKFGRSVVGLRKLARGIDESGIRTDAAMRSVSREVTFDNDTDDFGMLAATLDSLARDLFETISRERLRYRTVTVKLRYHDFRTRTKMRSRDQFHSDLQTIRSVAGDLLSEIYTGEKVRLLGLRLSYLRGEDSKQKKIGDFSGPAESPPR